MHSFSLTIWRATMHIANFWMEIQLNFAGSCYTHVTCSDYIGVRNLLSQSSFSQKDQILHFKTEFTSDML